MSQETLHGLLGWFLIVASIWMTCLALQQVALLALRLVRTIRTLSGRRLNKIKQKFSDEEDRIGEEVEPMFELWWSEIGKKIVENSPSLYENVVLPPGIDEIPEQVKAMVAGPALHFISQSAQEFAIHLASKPSHDAFIEEVRRIDSKMAASYLEQYEMHLDEHRSQLADLGINIAEFEAQFSAA